MSILCLAKLTSSSGQFHAIRSRLCVEELLRSPNASGVLRSALWTSNPDASQQHQERLITSADLQRLRALHGVVEHLCARVTGCKLRYSLNPRELRTD